MFDIKCEDGYQDKGGLMAPSQCQYPHSLPPVGLHIHLDIFSFMLTCCIYILLLLTCHVVIPLCIDLHSSLCSDHLIHTNLLTPLQELLQCIRSILYLLLMHLGWHLVFHECPAFPSILSKPNLL